MKLIKTITEGLPEGYSIKIRAKYHYCNWDNRYEVQVKCTLFGNAGLDLEEWGTNVSKPPARKFIFFKNNVTWKQKVEDKMAYGEQYLRDWLCVKLQDDEINKGLLASLDKL